MATLLVNGLEFFSLFYSNLKAVNTNKLNQLTFVEEKTKLFKLFRSIQIFLFRKFHSSPASNLMKVLWKSFSSFEFMFDANFCRQPRHQIISPFVNRICKKEKRKPKATKGLFAHYEERKLSTL